MFEPKPVLIKMNRIFKNLKEMKNVGEDMIIDLLSESPKFPVGTQSDPIEYLTFLYNQVNVMRWICNFQMQKV